MLDRFARPGNRTMRVFAAALLTVLATGPAVAATHGPAAQASTEAQAPAAAPAAPLDMETIMANPDWIGPPVEDAYWGVDGSQVYYSLKRDGSPVRDLWRVPARRRHAGTVGPGGRRERRRRHPRVRPGTPARRLRPPWRHLPARSRHGRHRAADPHGGQGARSAFLHRWPPADLPRRQRLVHLCADRWAGGEGRGPRREGRSEGEEAGRPGRRPAVAVQDAAWAACRRRRR